MKSKIIIVVFSLFWLLCQNAQAQNSFCHTESNTPNLLENLPNGKLQMAANSYQLNVFTHLIRRSDGTGGITAAELTTALEVLAQDLEPHGICIHHIGSQNLSNTTYYNNWSGNFDNIVATNAHTNAIDIYFAPNTASAGGRADGIPSTALVVGGTWSDGTIINTSHVVSHEFGHCLGLYHTHHGTVTECCGDPGQCAELVNGSNCGTCGDYVCDTPADPHIQFNVNASCQWQGSGTDANGQAYAPDERNIMAYTQPVCMDYYTGGQGQRALDMIANSSALQAVVASTTCGSCDANLTLSGTITNTQNYEASSTITSTQVLTSSANVDYKAGSLIVLNPGFTASNGTDFHAYIGNCGGSLVADEPVVAFNEEQEDFYTENLAYEYADVKNVTQQILQKSDYQAFKCYPNPFQNLTTIEYHLEEEGEVRLTVHDLNGRLVKQLIQRTEAAGTHQVQLKAKNLAVGMYYARLHKGGDVFTTKLILME